MDGIPYLQWYKTCGEQAKYCIGASGIKPCTRMELPFIKWDLEFNGSMEYGYPPLTAAIAKHYSVDPDSVMTTTGASMANFIVMASLLKAGDEVLVEHPVYDPILQVLNYLNIKIKRLHRTVENQFQIDLTELEKNINKKTKLIILTNLHNPSGALLTNEVLTQVGDIAHHYQSKILIDEIYLDLMFSDKQPTAFTLGKQFIITNSLTKTYGLGGLRCGWIFAAPALIKKFCFINDLTEGSQVHMAEMIGLQMFQNIQQLEQRAQNILVKNRKLLFNFFKDQDNLQVLQCPYATTYFPKLLRGNVEKLITQLRDNYETSVIPGHFFEMPQHFRIGVGGDTDIFAEGLKRLAAYLNQ